MLYALYFLTMYGTHLLHPHRSTCTVREKHLQIINSAASVGDEIGVGEL